MKGNLSWFDDIACKQREKQHLKATHWLICCPKQTKYTAMLPTPSALSILKIYLVYLFVLACAGLFTCCHNMFVPTIRTLKLLKPFLELPFCHSPKHWAAISCSNSGFDDDPYSNYFRTKELLCLLFLFPFFVSSWTLALLFFPHQFLTATSNSCKLYGAMTVPNSRICCN